MSIATKTGDKGETSLIGGCRVKKNDERVELYGTIDELTSVIGIAIFHVKNKKIKKTLEKVQDHLFTIGAELASLGVNNEKIPKLSAKHLEFIEKTLFEIEKNLPVQKGFILPKGVQSACFLHFARTICRNVERKVINCSKYNINPEIIKYLNRLSDLLFIFARKENHDADFNEVYVKYE